jgi:TolA-binding protein
LGDWYARSGNAKESRQSYEKAETGRELAYSSAERNAWRGAHSRSAEAYLRSNELDRVRSELDRWQLDFPDDKWEGYLSYVLARYWMARERFDQAAAVANDLLVVNPNSPYADRLLFLAAECEQESGRHQRATAVYESLIRDYPGSPLVDRAKQEVKRIQSGPPSGERKGSKKPKQKAVEKRP